MPGQCCFLRVTQEIAHALLAECMWNLKTASAVVMQYKMQHAAAGVRKHLQSSLATSQPLPVQVLVITHYSLCWVDCCFDSCVLLGLPCLLRVLHGESYKYLAPPRNQKEREHLQSTQTTANRHNSQTKHQAPSKTQPKSRITPTSTAAMHTSRQQPPAIIAHTFPM